MGEEGLGGGGGWGVGVGVIPICGAEGAFFVVSVLCDAGAVDCG